MLAQSCGPDDQSASVVEHVDFQRTDPAAGFDDLHLWHRFPTGCVAAPYVQIKRTLPGRRS